MGKTLVSENRVESHICAASNTIYVDGLILTPGAKDYLRNKGTTIVYGPKPEEETPAAKDPAQMVATLLREEYGIADPAQLKAICCKVLAALEDGK